MDQTIATVLSAVPVTGISIGGLVMLIVLAFVREWVYTRGAMVAERVRHAEEMAAERARHALAIVAIRDDYKEQVRILREDRNERIAEYQTEVSDWREAYRGLEMALATALSQSGEMLELSRSAEHALRSLPEVSEKVASDD